MKIRKDRQVKLFVTLTAEVAEGEASCVTIYRRCLKRPGKRKVRG